jgi:N-acetylmuramoyl-L-alanine amidase
MGRRLCRAAALLVAALLSSLIGSDSDATAPKKARDTLSLIERSIEITLPTLDQLDREQRDAVTCVAITIYHESRGEPERGRIAVAVVVRNRMRERHLSACAVVFEPWQFSFTAEPIGRLVPRDLGAWSRSLREAYRVLIQGEGRMAWNHFVAPAVVRPSWLRSCKSREQIGAHLFCRI